MFKKGNQVVFNAKVFKKPYTPYYDTYKGHVFEVENISDGHVKLKCVSDPKVIVNGRVHEDELQLKKV